MHFRRRFEHTVCLKPEGTPTPGAGSGSQGRWKPAPSTPLRNPFINFRWEVQDQGVPGGGVVQLTSLLGCNPHFFPRRRDPLISFMNWHRLNIGSSQPVPNHFWPPKTPLLSSAGGKVPPGSIQKFNNICRPQVAFTFVVFFSIGMGMLELRNPCYIPL